MPLLRKSINQCCVSMSGDSGYKRQRKARKSESKKYLTQTFRK